MISFNSEILISCAKPLLLNLVIKIDVAIGTSENLLKMAVLNKPLNKADMVKVG